MKKALIELSQFSGFAMALVAIILMVSCSMPPKQPDPPPYNDALTQFIVIDMKQLDGMKVVTSYRVEVVDANGLIHNNDEAHSNLKFWFCDTLGKYKLGQPIHFDKNH